MVEREHDRSSQPMAHGAVAVEIFRFIRRLGGDPNERDEVRRFDPEGMSAMSRGLSVRDTPGAKPSRGDLHPEGMLASTGCLPVTQRWHPFRMQQPFAQPLPGVSLRSTPG